MNDDRDAYGNPLPRATRRQLAKEARLYKQIGAQLARAEQGGGHEFEPEEPGSRWCATCHREGTCTSHKPKKSPPTD